MFKAKKAALRFTRMEGKWVKCTGVSPADNGQIVSRAIDYMDNLDLQPEDAWLTALTSWMNGLPWPDSRAMVASALIEFLNTYEGKITLSRQTTVGARAAAMAITESYLNPENPGPRSPGTGLT